MKRLFQISLDTLLTSLLPIIMWIVLGVVINKDISNVFSLTYPLQFFYMIFTCIFAIGPNITSKKLKNKNIVFSNMFLGVIFVGIITLLLVVNANLYISTMNMDKEIYHNFCIYAMLWLYISFILQIIIQKLYYENKNKEANKTSILINITNFVLIILFSYLYKDYVAIFITLIVDFTLILFCLYKNFKSYSLNIDFKIGENIKYTSFSILKNIGMFLVYGIGFGNSFSYGNEYISAINFESLTTDTQWDILESVDTASKIDLAENRFDYKKSLKNAYKLLAILITSIILMNMVLYWYFKPNIKILFVLLFIQFIDLLVDPIKTLKWSYLQINDNNKKHNVFYLFSRIIRLLCSFIPSAFCTYIGQFFSMIYLYIYAKIQCKNVKLFK